MDEPYDTPARQPLILLADERRFEFPGYFWRPGVEKAFCWLRIFHDPEISHFVIIATELPENEGLSVTNGAERIMTLVAEQFPDINGDNYVYIEHYIAGRVWEPQAHVAREWTEAFTRQHFSPCDYSVPFFRIRYDRPRPEFMTRAEVEAMIGQPLDDSAYHTPKEETARAAS